MASPQTSRVLLLAVQHAAEGNLEALQALYQNHNRDLRPELLYRVILAHCPSDVPNQDLFSLLHSLEDSTVEHQAQRLHADVEPFKYLDDAEVLERLRSIRLPPLPISSQVPEDDLLSRYFIARAHRTGSSGEDLASLTQTLVPFLDHSLNLRGWFISEVLPILRLNYEYYPDQTISMSLEDLEALRGRLGVERLLENCTKLKSGKSGVVRDLRGLVGPWIYGRQMSKRRKLSHHDSRDDFSNDSQWSDVNEWLVATGLHDPTTVEEAITGWNGPSDVDVGMFESPLFTVSSAEDIERYHQTAIATIYASQDTSRGATTRARKILNRVSELSGIKVSGDARIEAPGFSPSILQSSRASLLHNALLNAENELTKPTVSSLDLLDALISSVEMLQSFQIQISFPAAASLCLFATSDQQMQELSRLLGNVGDVAKSGTDWHSIRRDLHWLRCWSATLAVENQMREDQSRRALFWKLDPKVIDQQLLKIMLKNNALSAADTLFLNSQCFLSTAEVETGILETIYEAYDNASNGNKTRGGIQRANQILSYFIKVFPQSVQLNQADKLIRATHALSFYQLLLQPGQLFKPVSIRLQKDALLLVEKVLRQNPKAYTNIDDLITIGQNLVESGLPFPLAESSDPASVKRLLAQHQVTYLAITSALSSHDFDTAYSYISTRFSTQLPPDTTDFPDDISWRAAYAAGSYELTPSSNSTSLRNQISHLQKRMELLSSALDLAPDSSSLPDILSTWQQCEAQLDYLKNEEHAQTAAFDDRAFTTSGSTNSNVVSFAGTSVIPGGFGSEIEDRERDVAETARLTHSRRQGGTWSTASKRGNSLASDASYGGVGGRAAGGDDEGPLGLFDVARGAASALQRSAVSTWNAGSATAPGIRSMPTRTGTGDDYASHIDQSGRGTPDSFSGSASQRLRKRDQISNLVTGGLVSGMSWVLGAPPAGRPAGADIDGGHVDYDERTAPDNEEE